MRRRRLNALFTVRGMMVVVALTALWLSAVDATRRAWPPRPPLPISTNAFLVKNWVRSDQVLWDGRVAVSWKNPATGTLSCTLLVRPPRPHLLWVCCPLVVAAAVTWTALIAARRVPRVSFGRKVMLILSLGTALLGVHGWWVLYGGELPLNRLWLGMTKEEARAIAGPPNPQGSTASSWLITRPGSLDWLRLEFNAEGRLRAYPPRSHLPERDLGSAPVIDLRGF
jgi:hypothetical protein